MEHECAFGAMGKAGVDCIAAAALVVFRWEAVDEDRVGLIGYPVCRDHLPDLKAKGQAEWIIVAHVETWEMLTAAYRPHVWLVRRESRRSA